MTELDEIVNECGKQEFGEDKYGYESYTPVFMNPDMGGIFFDMDIAGVLITGPPAVGTLRFSYRWQLPHLVLDLLEKARRRRLFMLDSEQFQLEAKIRYGSL